MSSKLPHFASPEDCPLCQLQVMFLTETRAPTRGMIDTSSANSWQLGAAVTKVRSSLEHLLLLRSALLLFRADTCDRPIPGTCRSLLRFSFTPLTYGQELFSPHTVIFTGIREDQRWLQQLSPLAPEEEILRGKKI